MNTAERRIIPVVVVLPPRTLLLDIAGPIEVLRKANLEQDVLRFELSYVGPSPTVRSSIGLDLTGIGRLPDSLPKGAMVLVPGNTDVTMGAANTAASKSAGNKSADQETAIVTWLRRTIRDDHTLVSICAGALLAGRAGLLDGRNCTTHHGCTELLQRLAPAARVLENRLFVEDGNCLTSAGITAGIDLMLHLLAQMSSPGLALAVARYLVVYLRRSGADPQLSPWLEGRNHIHPTIHRVQDAIVAEPARSWTLEDLAAIGHTSSRHLSRLFNEHASMSVTDYINRVRVVLARELIEGTRLDMESVAVRAGFGSPRQLRRAWNRYHVMPPTRVRRAKAAKPSALSAMSGTVPQLSTPTQIERKSKC